MSLPKLLFKGKGCKLCGDSGYRGRLGIYEILEVDEKIRQLIAGESFTLGALRGHVAEQGMKSMFEDGLLKAREGKTTIEEILRVIRE